MKRHLVVQLARFGDLIQTKRLIAELEEEGAETHLCVDSSLIDLARLVFPMVRVHGIIAHGAGNTGPGASARLLLENRQTFAELQSLDFDRVYNLNFSGLNFALSTLFDPETVAGYRKEHGQDLKGWWPSMAFRFARERRLGVNLVDFWAAFGALGLDPATINPAASPRGNGLGVVLAGRNARRSLPPKVLAPIIAARWERADRCPVHLLGGKAEQGAARELLAELTPGLRERAVDLTGKTDWKGLADIVSSLDEILSPDTGTMHLAAHLGTPVTAFFLSSAWCFETGPYGRGHTVWQAMEPCGPCLESKPCDNGLACLTPFKSPELLRTLATGKTDRPPRGLTGFSSDFDGLGLVFSAFAGEDPEQPRRAALRAFLAKRLEPSKASSVAANHDLALKFFLERDWMTEQHT